MRHVLLCLLIALLPLRGWAVQDMGVRMAATPAAAALADADASAMPADCPMFQGAPADADGTLAHATCASCQLCMALAGVRTQRPTLAAPRPGDPPRAGPSLFASAERTRLDKPPIA